MTNKKVYGRIPTYDELVRALEKENCGHDCDNCTYNNRGPRRETFLKLKPDALCGIEILYEFITRLAKLSPLYDKYLAQSSSSSAVEQTSSPTVPQSGRSSDLEQTE